MNLEDVDLRLLATRLRERANREEPEGYLQGKSTMRDLVESLLGCSALEAEDLVDTLEARGYLRFEGNPAERAEAAAYWQIDPGAEL